MPNSKKDPNEKLIYGISIKQRIIVTCGNQNINDYIDNLNKKIQDSVNPLAFIKLKEELFIANLSIEILLDKLLLNTEEAKAKLKDQAIRKVAEEKLKETSN